MENSDEHTNVRTLIKSKNLIINVSGKKGAIKRQLCDRNGQRKNK